MQAPSHQTPSLKAHRHPSPSIAIAWKEDAPSPRRKLRTTRQAGSQIMTMIWIWNNDWICVSKEKWKWSMTRRKQKYIATSEVALLIVPSKSEWNEHEMIFSFCCDFGAKRSPRFKVPYSPLSRKLVANQRSCIEHRRITKFYPVVVQCPVSSVQWSFVKKRRERRQGLQCFDFVRHTCWSKARRGGIWVCTRLHTPVSKWGRAGVS